MTDKLDLNQFFLNPPRPSCTLSILDPTVKGLKPNPKDVFNFLFCIFCVGIKSLYGDVESFRDLSKEQIQHLGRYIKSIGAELCVQARIQIQTKEITDFCVNFKALIPEFQGVDKYCTLFTNEKISITNEKISITEENTKT